MTDFWENHFSVFNGKMPTRYTLLEYDRDVIRPHALGKFRELLGAVAHSPAMLYYLDNFQSAADYGAHDTARVPSDGEDGPASTAEPTAQRTQRELWARTARAPHARR